MSILRFSNQLNAKAYIESKVVESLTMDTFYFSEKLVKLCSYPSNRLLDESYFVDLDVLDSCINIIIEKSLNKETA